MNTTIHQTTTTTSGKEAAYGYERGTTWISLDHGRNVRSVIYATPTWASGMTRLRKLIDDHGIIISQEHQHLFKSQQIAA